LRPVWGELSTTYPHVIHIQQGDDGLASTPDGQAITNNYKEEVQKKKYKEVPGKSAKNRILLPHLPDYLWGTHPLLLRDVLSRLRILC